MFLDLASTEVVTYSFTVAARETDFSILKAQDFKDWGEKMATDEDLRKMMKRWQTSADLPRLKMAICWFASRFLQFLWFCDLNLNWLVASACPPCALSSFVFLHRFHSNEWFFTWGFHQCSTERFFAPGNAVGCHRLGGDQLLLYTSPLGSALLLDSLVNFSFKILAPCPLKVLWELPPLNALGNCCTPLQSKVLWEFPTWNSLSKFFW